MVKEYSPPWQGRRESRPYRREEQFMSDAQRGLGRRDFLLGAAGAAAVPMGLGALSAPALATGRGGGHDHRHGGQIPRDQISIQLYTVREQLAADLDGTLRALARIGYRTVEHAGF